MVGVVVRRKQINKFVHRMDLTEVPVAGTHAAGIAGDAAHGRAAVIRGFAEIQPGLAQAELLLDTDHEGIALVFFDVRRVAGIIVAIAQLLDDGSQFGLRR